MLLTRMIRRLRGDDRGAAMAAVMGLMTVGLLTSALVATTVIASTAYTSATRAGIEAQAAAEAGVAAARAGLIAGTCTAKGHSYASEPDAVPRYEATIWVPSGAGWVRGCPPGTGTQVRILSTGWAERTGVHGVSGRDVATVEVVLSSASTPTQIVATGPAIYAFSSSGFGGGGKLVSIDGSSPEILIKQGDVVCNGGASGQADIVVDGGDLRVEAGCIISGNAWASGKVTLPGGPNIGGNVVANALEITGGSKVGGHAWITNHVSLVGNVEIGGNVTAGSMSFTNGGTVRGNAQVAGGVVFSGGGPQILGNLTAASLTTGNGGVVGGHAWIHGATSVNWGATLQKDLTTGSFTKPGGTDSNFVKGTLTVVPGGPGPSPYATNPGAPAYPLVPDWVDFGFEPADWTGFAVAHLSSATTCGYAQLVAAVASFGGQPGIIDALGCAGGVYIGSDHKLALTADLAIFAHKFNLTEGGGFASEATRRLWLITPDLVDDGQPTCTGGDASFGVSGGFTFSAALQVFMYTPCRVALGSSTNFRGQVFAGKASIDGAAVLGYVAVGLPGVDLDTGETAEPGGTEADRTILVYRNVEAG